MTRPAALALLGLLHLFFFRRILGGELLFGSDIVLEHYPALRFASEHLRLWGRLPY